MNKIKAIVKFSNLLIKKGKKSKATSIFLKTLFLIKKKTGKNPTNLFFSAIKLLTPAVTTSKRVIAGRLYNLPSPVTKNKALYFSCHWLQQAAITSKEKVNTLSEKLCLESLKVLKKKGSAITTWRQHNKTVLENRPFLRFIKKKRTLRRKGKKFVKNFKFKFFKKFKSKFKKKANNENFTFDFSNRNVKKVKSPVLNKNFVRLQKKSSKLFIKVNNHNILKMKLFARKRRILALSKKKLLLKKLLLKKLLKKKLLKKKTLKKKPIKNLNLNLNVKKKNKAVNNKN